MSYLGTELGIERSESNIDIVFLFSISNTGLREANVHRTFTQVPVDPVSKTFRNSKMFLEARDYFLERDSNKSCASHITTATCVTPPLITRKARLATGVSKRPGPAQGRPTLD